MTEIADDIRALPPDTPFAGVKKRLLQWLARSFPAGPGLRVLLHRWRGVRIGEDVRIGFDVTIETAHPEFVSIGNRVQLGIRTLILAHEHALPPKKSEWDSYISVRIEDDVNIGAGAMILPNVTIGRGSVVAAGSVVGRSVPPMTMVQGNPARPVARCEIPLNWDTPYRKFLSNLRPLKSAASSTNPSASSKSGIAEL